MAAASQLPPQILADSPTQILRKLGSSASQAKQCSLHIIATHTACSFRTEAMQIFAQVSTAAAFPARHGPEAR